MLKYPIPRRAFTLREFCELRRIGLTKAYAEAKAGRLKIRKVGRKSLVLPEDAAEWDANLPLMHAR
ncbi:MAG: DNA-binding protein [Beijerinckiaceae bacterium]